MDGYTGGDTVVLAEPGDNEVLGAHTLESLGLTADPVKKALVPTVGLALLADTASSIPVREIERPRGQSTQKRMSEKLKRTTLLVSDS